MQIAYNNDKIRKIICNDKELKKKIGLEVGKCLRKRINQLEATENFQMYLEKVRLGKPHSLDGNLKKCYGINVSANFRLIIEPKSRSLKAEDLANCKIINIKGVVEYHDGKNEWIIS